MLPSSYKLKECLKSDGNEKAFICEKCPETFSEEEHLNKHLRSYSG